MRRMIGVLLCLWLSTIQTGCMANSRMIDLPLEPSGTDALRAGDYKKALFGMKSDTVIRDSVFRLFKLGCIAEGMEDWSKALLYFRLCAQKSPSFAPFAYEKIGDIGIQMKRYEIALKALRSALERTTLPGYQRLLYKKIYTLVQTHGNQIDTPLVWLEDVLNQSVQITPPPSPENLLKDSLRNLLVTSSVENFDNLIQEYRDSSIFRDDQKCFICSLVVARGIDEKVLSTRTLFFLANTAYGCRDMTAAQQWFDHAEKRKDFKKTVGKRAGMLFNIQLQFALKKYSKTVKLVQTYAKTYKPEAWMVYQTARAYRAMDNDQMAALWYDKYVELFPQKEKAQEIMWYRAWQFEEQTKYDEARKLYRQLFTKNKNKDKAADAYFRYALTYFKQDMFDSANIEFSRWIKKYSANGQQLASLYWKMKSLYYKKDIDSARLLCKTIIQRWPTNYYSHRSHELLDQIGSSEFKLPIDTVSSMETTVQWLESLKADTVASLSDSDNVQFYLGTCLASVGMMAHAKALMDRLLSVYQNNLAVQFMLCRFYQRYGDEPNAFRIGRQFGWKLPFDSQSQVPIHIYNILYPYVYFDTIAAYASANSLEPELVYALIRQESIFNPKIVSPAGAIGLMQIMPYTGKEIADDLKEKFSQDSLYKPDCNIRYGTYYLSKLLKIFNGNLVLAIASYNGGPNNARRWHSANSNDSLDLFIEDISFSETRTYVKKVLENLWNYKYLKNFRAAKPSKA
ncbi:MAG: transglycosylase SLT domain-containing protein [Chitinivibrionales bacterium]|nr:transglycosylase SLT domain-containing protein [Chitinivibrionales bacterium]